MTTQTAALENSARADSPRKLIEIKDLTKVYGVGNVAVQALRGINATVKQGEFVAVMGASGSGKSTLMNILGCLDRPTSGTYILDGQDVSRLSKNRLASVRNKNIGFVFQSYNLLPRFTAVKNVTLPLMYNGYAHKSDKERTERAATILESVGLAERARHKPNELSGGQQQRVAIARALINNPQLILADEPTGNLDSASGASIMQLLSDLHQSGRAVLVVTHDTRMVRFATQKIFLLDG